jgi:hypothetical protein
MLSLDDECWNNLKGGYRTKFDPRPLLAKLEIGKDIETVWHELWEELHHQGDVGDASYAAVPHIVRIHRGSEAGYWDTYAIVAIIELARGQRENPDVPEWLEKEYFAAIRELSEIGSSEVLRAKAPEDVRAILSVIAIARGARTHGKFLVEYTEEELLDIESR